MSKPVGMSDKTYDISLQDLLSGFHELKGSQGTHSMQAVIAFYAGALIQRVERLVTVLEAQQVTSSIVQGLQIEEPYTNGAKHSPHQRSA